MQDFDKKEKKDKNTAAKLVRMANKTQRPQEVGDCWKKKCVAEHWKTGSVVEGVSSRQGLRKRGKGTGENNFKRNSGNNGLA